MSLSVVPLGEGHAIHFPIARHFRLDHGRRLCIRAHAVSTAGIFVGALSRIFRPHADSPARSPASSFRMNVHRNTAAIVRTDTDHRHERRLQFWCRISGICRLSYRALQNQMVQTRSSGSPINMPGRLRPPEALNLSICAASYFALPRSGGAIGAICRPEFRHRVCGMHVRTGPKAHLKCLETTNNRGSERLISPTCWGRPGPKPMILWFLLRMHLSFRSLDRLVLESENALPMPSNPLKHGGFCILMRSRSLVHWQRFGYHCFFAAYFCTLAFFGIQIAPLRQINHCGGGRWNRHGYHELDVNKVLKAKMRRV